MGNPITERWRFYDGLIATIDFSIVVRRHFFIEPRPVRKAYWSHSIGQTGLILIATAPWASHAPKSRSYDEVSRMDRTNCDNRCKLDKKNRSDKIGLFRFNDQNNSYNLFSYTSYNSAHSTAITTIMERRFWNPCNNNNFVLQFSPTKSSSSKHFGVHKWLQSYPSASRVISMGSCLA